MSHAGEVSSPSHHLMAIWCSLGSRLRPRPGDGTAESHAEEAWGDDKNYNYYDAILHHSYAILHHEQKADQLKMMVLYNHALCPTSMYMTS